MYVSTAKTRAAAAFDAIDLQPGQLLVDLGCGDGHMLQPAGDALRFGQKAMKSAQ